jgi:hypothetical protein
MDGDRETYLLVVVLELPRPIHLVGRRWPQGGHIAPRLSDCDDSHDADLKEIGRIAIADTIIAQILEGMLWDLMDSDDNVGATITKGWNFARVLDQTRSLIRIRVKNEDVRKRALEWLRKAKWAHTQRNDIIHSALMRQHPDDERLSRVKMVPGEDEAMVIESFKPAALTYLADAYGPIQEEGMEVWDALGPWTTGTG